MHPDSGPLQTVTPPPDLADLATVSTGSAPLGGPPGELPHTRLGRYTVYEEIAHGGMGAVLRGHDERLNRELAIKVLHPQYCDSATVSRRFTDEAQIGGQLQHPGIVPVYDLGVLPDGRPFFAMKLVKGRTLADLLGERPDPAHDLPRFLKVFEQVCQTMAYAHSRHVIHRDLKPSNIMVGAFGEVQVMDWGVAKVLDKTAPAAPAVEAAPTTEIHTSRSDTPDLETQAGAVLGTRAYMSPEQARGQTDLLSERSDVFGLGAILCEILTGRPPYCDAPPDQLRVMTLVADLAAARARLDACGADAELVALAQNCLAAAVEGRPRDAGAVAAAVTAYLTGVQERLQRAELDRTAAQVKAAEERKRRRVTLALAAAVLAVVLTGGVALALVQSQRRARQEQTALLVNQALGQATGLREQARALRDQPQQTAALWRDALAAAGRAERALASGTSDADTRSRIEQLLADLRAEAAEAEKDRRMLQQLADARDLAQELQESDYVRPRRIQEFVFGLAAAPAYAAAFREYGIDVETLTTAEAAARVRQRPIRLQLAAALDDWYFLAPEAAGGRLLEVSRLADPDPLRDRVRVAISQKDRTALKELADSDAAIELSPPTLILLADVLYQQGQRAEALQLLLRAQNRYPNDFWVNDVLGLHLRHAEPPRYAEAGRCFAAAIALRPTSPLGWSNLGTLLAVQGHLDAAVAVLREGVRARPDFTTTYERLCEALLLKGETDQALATAQEALRRQPDSPMMLTALGRVLQAQGKPQEAIATFRKVLARHPEWVRARLALAVGLSESGASPEVVELLEEAQRSHPEWHDVYLARGVVLLNRGEVEGAVEACQKAVELVPTDPFAWSGLGQALAAKGNHEGALVAHRKAVSMVPGAAGLRARLAATLRLKGRLEEAAAECREAIRLNPVVAMAHNELGLVFYRQGRHAEAAAALREAIRLQPTAASLHDNLGVVLRQMKDYDGATAAYREALCLAPDNAWFHNNLGHAYSEQRKYAEAIPHYEAAVRLKPTEALLHVNLAAALRRKGDTTSAVTSLREAARLDPKSASIQQTLALALLQAQQRDEALAAAREAVRLEPQSARAHNTLALALERNGMVEEALAEYREAVRLSPSDALPHATLGLALYRKQQYAEAVVAFREAVRLQPGSALHHNQLGQALAGMRQYTEAVAEYRKAVELEPGNARYHADLALALVRQRDYREAEAAARKAIELDPKQTEGYNVLGHVCFAQDRLDEAAAHYQQAVDRNPRSAVLHTNLGQTFLKQKKDAEAEACYRRAVLLDAKAAAPRLGLGSLLLKKDQAAAAEEQLRQAVELEPANGAGHAQLSTALRRRGKIAEAVQAARKAVQLQPSSARGHFRLGEALVAQGAFAEALGAFQQAKQLGLPDDDRLEPLPWDERIRECTRYLELDTTLAAVRDGKLKVIAAAELAALGRFCREQKDQPLAAVQFYTDAFTADPKLAGDLRAGHRFAAARAAVRAAANQGRDADQPDATEQGRLRQQALDWLRAELGAWAERLRARPDDPEARAALAAWQKEADLLRARDEKVLTKLPEAEQAAWRQLWSDWAAWERQAGK
jgi:serine/threonine-protein kinase